VVFTSVVRTNSGNVCYYSVPNCYLPVLQNVDHQDIQNNNFRSCFVGYEYGTQSLILRAGHKVQALKN
jgi:hypothetical protein